MSAPQVAHASVGTHSQNDRAPCGPPALRRSPAPPWPTKNQHRRVASAQRTTPLADIFHMPPRRARGCCWAPAAPGGAPTEVWAPAGVSRGGQGGSWCRGARRPADRSAARTQQAPPAKKAAATHEERPAIATIPSAVVALAADATAGAPAAAPAAVGAPAPASAVASPAASPRGGPPARWSTLLLPLSARSVGALPLPAVQAVDVAPKAASGADPPPALPLARAPHASGDSASVVAVLQALEDAAPLQGPEAPLAALATLLTTAEGGPPELLAPHLPAALALALHHSRSPHAAVARTALRCLGALFAAHGDAAARLADCDSDAVSSVVLRLLTRATGADLQSRHLAAEANAALG